MIDMPSFEQQQKLQAALSLHQAGRLDQAAGLYRQIIGVDPINFIALHYLGLLEAGLGHLSEAKSLIARSLAIQPPNIEFMENYASILFQSGDYSSALQTCRHGLQLRGTSVTLLYVSAISLYRLKKFEDAIRSFDQLLLLQPAHVVAINERGTVLAEMKQYEAALACFEKALALQPDYAEAHLNRANAFGALRRHDEAFDAYAKALAIKPDLAQAWLGRGNLFAAIRQHDNALAAYDRALALQPNLAEALLGRGNALREFRRHEEAFAAYDRAVELRPDLNYAAGARLFTKLNLCDWTSLSTETEKLLSMIRQGMAASIPFYLLAFASSARDQLQCARLQAQERASFPQVRGGEKYSHDRIRVAYLSADFHEHPVAYLTAGLFEHHDRSRFETTALSFAPDHNSPTQRRLKSAFEHFIDVRDRSDQEVAELMRELEIDIAVDLMGFTMNNRHDVLARRAAPVQVNYLGYSGTTGADYIDYILADATIIPEDQCAFYAEQVVWLSDSYLVNDNRRRISERTPTRGECGLPEDALVFCCFNNSYKIAPATFQVWMRLLQAVPGSVLWLSAANASAQRNLSREAERCGVPAQRLIFAPRMAEVADHLARQRQADLFLDTLPYNAHTTASDALWAGVPVLTCLGATFAGRVAASLLKAVGLDELITYSLEEYEALALKLARDGSYLASVKDKLARNRNTFPLFDTARSTRHIEAAYTMMWERHQRGEPAKPHSGEAKPIRIA